MYVEDDVVVTPRIRGGSRAKRNQNRVEECDGWDSDDCLTKRHGLPKNTMRRLKEAAFNQSRKKTAFEEAVRTALYDLPYDVQEIIAEKANIPLQALHAPIKVLHVRSQ